MRTAAVSAGMKACAGILAVLVVVMGVHVAEARVFSVSFQEARRMRSPDRQSVTLFFDGGDKSHKAQVAVMKAADKAIEGVEFYKVDCSQGLNKEAAIAAEMTSFPYVFVKLYGSPIGEYTYELTVDSLQEFVQSTKLPANTEDILDFDGEENFYELIDLSEDPKPILVKFYEPTCVHCEKLRRPFNQAATKHRDEVISMGIRCSANDDAGEFCDANDISDVPTVVLFTGEEKIKYTGPDDFLGISRFIESQRDKFPSDGTSKPASKPKQAKSTQRNNIPISDDVDELKEQVRDLSAEVKRLKDIISRAALALEEL